MSELALVTGASGFIGYHLVQALIQNGTRVRCLVRKSSDTSRLPIENIELVVGDILEPTGLENAVRGVSTVYHAAGNIDASQRKTLYKVNVEGTRNIASACANQSDPPVLVYLSSLGAGGPEVDGNPRGEQDLPAPATRYGESKLMGEFAAAEFAAQVPMTFVRASAVFGQYDQETLNAFKAFQIGGVDLYPLPGAYRVRLSLIHARDLADFLILTADQGERRLPEEQIITTGHGIYYCAYDERPSYAELIEMAAHALGNQRVRIIEIPVGVVWLAGALSEVWSRFSGRPAGIINLDKARAVAAGSWTCTPEKSIRLGFSPPLGLSDRINETAIWYQENGWL